MAAGAGLPQLQRFAQSRVVPRTPDAAVQIVVSQTPPQSGWLDELGHLKGGRLLRAYFLASEAPVIAIRGLLLADVLAYLLQLKPNRGHRVAACPEVLP